MDGYARYMLDCEVGVCNDAEVAIMKFYLKSVTCCGFPQTVHSDKGKETDLMAGCQLRFHRQKDPTTLFQKAYIFGKSTRNIRIESWWGRLISSQTEPWKRHFELLKAKGFFDGSAIDKMALQYLYMDEIRAQIQGFVEVHNNHLIKKQKNCDYLPTGIPYELYHYLSSGVHNYAQVPDQDFLCHLQEQVADWDPERYLQPEVEAFCTERLEAGGFPPKKLIDFSHNNVVHINAYKYLQQEMLQHVLNRNR